MLKVTHVEAACIKLHINDKYVGIKYWVPFVFDITGFVKDGANKVEITAASTLFNLMGPNRYAGISDVTVVKPHTFVEADKYSLKYELLPFGIGGAVVL